MIKNGTEIQTAQGTFTVPRGNGGLAIRFMCDFLKANPGATRDALLRAACDASTLNYSTAGWLVSPDQPGRPSPVGNIISRTQVKDPGANRATYRYHLLPAGEVLCGTFAATKLAQETAEDTAWRKRHGRSIGSTIVFTHDITGYTCTGPGGTTIQVSKGTVGAVIGLKHNGRVATVLTSAGRTLDFYLGDSNRVVAQA